jgi:hypothetical protein
MEGRRERVEPLDRAHDLSSLGGEVEAVAWGDRSMQQCHGRSENWCERGRDREELSRCRPAKSEDHVTVIGILSAIIVGLVIGALGRLVFPGR